MWQCRRLRQASVGSSFTQNGEAGCWSTGSLLRVQALRSETIICWSVGNGREAAVPASSCARRHRRLSNLVDSMGKRQQHHHGVRCLYRYAGRLEQHTPAPSEHVNALIRIWDRYATQELTALPACARGCARAREQRSFSVRAEAWNIRPQVRPSRRTN